MIPIDICKFNFLSGVDKDRCNDGSVRFVQYTKPKRPEEYATLRCLPSYYGERTEYSLSVHLPQQRNVDILATVSHTSANCWKVMVSTLSRSDVITCKTLNEVIDELKRVFGVKSNLRC